MSRWLEQAKRAVQAQSAAFSHPLSVFFLEGLVLSRGPLANLSGPLFEIGDAQTWSIHVKYMCTMQDYLEIIRSRTFV